MKTTIYSQHHDQISWLNKLSLYNDEMALMRKKLEEVGNKTTVVEVRNKVEHFQNQFVSKKNHSDDLQHQITRDNKDVQGMIKKNQLSGDQQRADDHTEGRGKVELFERAFHQLRTEFNLFLLERV